MGRRVDSLSDRCDATRRWVDASMLSLCNGVPVKLALPNLTQHIFSISFFKPMRRGKRLEIKDLIAAIRSIKISSKSELPS